MKSMMRAPQHLAESQVSGIFPQLGELEGVSIERPDNFGAVRVFLHGCREQVDRLGHDLGPERVEVDHVALGAHIAKRRGSVADARLVVGDLRGLQRYGRLVPRGLERLTVGILAGQPLSKRLLHGRAVVTQPLAVHAPVIPFLRLLPGQLIADDVLCIV